MRRLQVTLLLAGAFGSTAARADDFVESADVHILATRPGEVDVTLVPRAVVDQGVAFESSRLLGYVIALHDGFMTVRLPVDVRVRVGDHAELRRAPGGGVDAIPSRPLRIFSISGELGVYAGFTWFGTSGGGIQTVSSAEVIYRASLPLSLHATLAHAALAFGSPSNLAAVDASLGAALDTDYFELGLGFGVMTVNDGSYYQAAAAFTVDPFMRIGAVDGIALFARTQLGVIRDTFRFASVSGELAFPVAARAWCFLRGAGGSDGFGKIDTGVRLLVRGNGDHDSVFLRFSLGLAVTFFHPISEDLIGPGASVGVELRP